MRALLAFDKFKDALTANDACVIAANALHARQPEWDINACPLTDGGEGFAEILTRAGGGRMHSLTVTGPRGDPVEAAFGTVPLAQIPSGARDLLALPGATIAIVEMAAASGLALLPAARRDPWQTSSRGTGELIRAAATAGATAIILGVGGSATNDLGLGALSALGFSFRSETNRAISNPTPAHWAEIGQIDCLTDRPLPPICIACDVTNPLLGPRGATAVYGPQKGLLSSDLPRLEHAAARIALMLCASCGQPDSLMDKAGAGAAGGIAFGLMAAAGARLLSGFNLVAAWLDLDARIAAADLVLTGEGHFDDSSLAGKGPGAVAARANACGKPVHVFAGAITVSAVSGFVLHAITPPGQPLADALRTAGANLAASVRDAF